MARQFRIELPLRVALVAATLLLVACGLTASGIAGASILRQHLIQRADQTLEEGSRGGAQAPNAPPTPACRPTRVCGRSRRLSDRSTNPVCNGEWYRCAGPIDWS